MIPGGSNEGCTGGCRAPLLLPAAMPAVSCLADTQQCKLKSKISPHHRLGKSCQKGTGVQDQASPDEASGGLLSGACGYGK